MIAMRSEKDVLSNLKRQVFPIGAASFAMAGILELVSLIPIFLMPVVIDEYIPSGNLLGVILCTLIFCGIPVLATFGNNWYQYFLILQSRRLVERIRLECFDKLIYQPMAFFDENHSAELADKTSQDVNSYIVVWTHDLPHLLSNLFAGLLLFVLLLRIHSVLAVVQLLYIPISTVLMKSVGGRLQPLIENVLALNAQSKKQIQEAFHSIRYIKAGQLEGKMEERLKGTQDGIMKIWGKVAFFDNFVGGISNTLIPGFFYGLTFVLAAGLAAAKIITIGYMTAAVGYATRIHRTFTDLVKTYNQFRKAQGEVTAIKNYLELADERERSGTKPWSFVKEICVENITFAYPNTDKIVLDHLNLVIGHGMWLGLYGASGIGKSTVLELLMRFYEADSGSIRIDGSPLQEISIAELRSHISYVPQEPVLFEGTIRENLLLARPGATEKELLTAAKKTGILDVIDEGLDRNVGESGMLLSGGERQRVALARCLLEEKELILLDEATSQMDAQTQDGMADMLRTEQMERGITIISVAHRREFHRYADEELEIRS